MSSGEEKSYLLGVIGKGFIKDKQGRFQKAVHSRQRKQPTLGLEVRLGWSNQGLCLQTGVEVGDEPERGVGPWRGGSWVPR